MSWHVPVGLLVGLVLGTGSWLALAPVWQSEILRRTNFRGRSLPVGGGLVFVVVIVLACAGLAGWRTFNGEPALSEVEAAGLLAVVGFTLLGFLDDVIGGAGARGLKGHLRSAAKGKVTTGFLKLFVGLALATVCASLISRAQTGAAEWSWQWVVDAALVAAAANLVNLFDLAPGRAIKVSLLGFVTVLVGAGAVADLLLPAIVVGAAVALLIPDLREKIMLGDTGANPLGATLGLAAVAVLSPTWRGVLCALVIGLNLLSEFASFGQMIDRVPPLRGLDRVGRMP